MQHEARGLTTARAVVLDGWNPLEQWTFPHVEGLADARASRHIGRL